MAEKTEKQRKLEELDELVLDKMIHIMGGENTSCTGGKPKLSDLSDLSTAVNYLRINQITSEKPKSTVEEDSKKRLKKAQDRREAKQKELDDDL